MVETASEFLPSDPPVPRLQSQAGLAAPAADKAAAFYANFSFQSPEGVHVWAVSLDLPASRLAAARRTLCQSELDRSARFHFEVHRDRYIAARGALRQLLGRYLSIPAERLEFDYGEKGKPVLAGSAKSSGLQFNLAHSTDQALIAISPKFRVGVDIEEIRALDDAEELVSRFFSNRESAEFKTVPEAERPLAFFNLWTRKEAWLKATGEGIAHLLSQVEVSFLPRQQAELLKLPPRYPAGTEWSLYEVACRPGFAGALAVAARAARPELRRWDDRRFGFVL